MKKAKSTKKFKGTRYVANVLRKYFKKKYPNYNAALPKAREVYAQLQSEGKKTTVANIQFLVRKHRIPKETSKQAPELFYKLTQAGPYFELISYPAYILTTTNQITFISELFNEGVEEIEGGSVIDYRETFSEFVNFCNRYHSDANVTESDEIKIFVVCTPPEKGIGEDKNKWYSRIISINDIGMEEDFGFIPGTQNIAPKYEKSKQKKQQTKTKQQPIQPVSADVEALRIQAEVEKTRQENIRTAMQLFASKSISKEEFKEMIAIINKQ